MQKIVLNLICMLCLAFTAAAHGPTILGPTSVSCYSSQTYSYNSSEAVFGPRWRLNHVYGTITSQWQSGSNYYVTITWHTVGIENLVFFNGYSPLSEITITINATPPAPPSAIAGTAITSTAFTATWNAVPGATGYRLDVSIDNFNSNLASYNNLIVTGTSQVVSGLSAGSTYQYRVRAVNQYGASGNSTAIIIYTAPPAPIASGATNITSNSFTANWSSAGGATGYRLDVSTAPNFSSYVIGYQNLAVAGTGKAVTNLPVNKTFYYRVRAENNTTPSLNSNIVTGADLDLSYVRTTDILKSGVLNQSHIDATPVGGKLEQTDYFDGLGRLLQTVRKQHSPAQMDIIHPFSYDTYGRENIKYLPYIGGNDGGFKPDALTDPSTAITTQPDKYRTGEHFAFYQVGGLLASDQYPYAETIFEASPLDRVAEQGAFGADWQPGTGHTQKNTVGLNASAEVLLFKFTAPTGTNPLGSIALSAKIYYNPHELHKTRTTDEDQHEVIVFIDKEGRTVLKKVKIDATNYAQTYYIYDISGNQVCVLQPEGVKKLLSNLTTSSFTTVLDQVLNDFAFRYVYDTRRRLTQKKLPGTAPVYMVYDNRDRLVLTQDGNQRNRVTKEWTFTKYDAFNRPVSTGRFASNNDLATMQVTVNTYYANLTSAQAWFESYKGLHPGNIWGYDNKSFPPVSTAADYYTLTYYDQYDSFIAPAGYTYTPGALIDPETSTAQAARNERVVGLVTGALVKNLSSGALLRTVTYYDGKYRPVQTISDHQKGKITTSYVVDFTGKILISNRTYTVNNVSKTVKESFKYDHAGRPVWTKHSIDGLADIMLYKNIYNELGQLAEKNLHSTNNGGTFKQSVDYRYTIRGWLTAINNPDVGAVASSDAGVDYFGMEMIYNTSIAGLSATKSYTGNIAAIRWSKGTGGTVRKQAYTFGYDPLNRMVNASHLDYEFDTPSGSWQWKSNNNGYGENLTYDLNGNINTLVRKGFKGAAMDNLAYSYTGNRLQYVNDAANAALGFVNGNTGTDDYHYDDNGNLDKDRNKGISNNGDIQYNYLNLPIGITRNTGEKIKYTYDATGRKLAREIYGTNGSTLVKVTDYIGEMVYEGVTPVLRSIQHAEGRILPSGAGWEYQYYLKDHLGNVRVTFTTKPQTATTVATTFESTADNNFLNYHNSTFDLVDHTDAGTTSKNVQWLNGGINGRVGLAKSIAMMPGDQITISAYAKYMNLGNTGNGNAFISQLASAFGVSPGSTGEQLKIYNGLTTYASAVPFGNHANDNEAAPKIFATILFFDRDYNFLDAAWDQVTTVGAQTSATVKQPPHDLLSITAKAPEAGYAFAFLSNEHPTFVDAYFDDASFTHSPSPIVATADYFPFGLTYNAGERTGTPAQKTLYNSKELQDELSLNWYDYGARMYMPETGRWGVNDPMAAMGTRWSPYTYAMNNPVRFIDPDGMWTTDADGNLVADRSDIRSMAKTINNNTRKQYRAMGGRTVHESARQSVFNTRKEEGNTPPPAQQEGPCPPGVDCDFVNHAAANHFHWHHKGEQINWFVAIGAEAGEKMSGAARIGSNGNLYRPASSGRVFQGNQYVNTFGISKGFHFVSRVSFFAALVMDGLAVKNYFQDPHGPNVMHPGKFTLNTGVGAFGLTGVGTIPSLFYFGINSFYPGGPQGYYQMLGNHASSIQGTPGEKVISSTFH
jgi:RHS repeat-associated protein